MWALLKPHVSILIDRFLFPIFCPSEEEIEQFTDEPKDWARSHASGDKHPLMQSVAAS